MNPVIIKSTEAAFDLIGDAIHAIEQDADFHEQGSLIVDVHIMLSAAALSLTEARKFMEPEQ